MPDINPPMNALIKKKPPQTLFVGAKKGQKGGQRVKVKYPFGCRIERVLDAHTVGVVFAAPMNAVKAEIARSNIVTSRQEVARWERKWLQSKNDGKGLGYPSIDDLERRKQQNSMYQ